MTSSGSAASTAGIVVWRSSPGSGPARPEDPTPLADIEILVVHPGGPFWAKKDQHAWSIPKGEFDPEDETPLDAATREFAEEMGSDVPPGAPLELKPFRAGKKRLHAFAVEGDFDVATIQPDDTHRSMVDMEWPPRSGERVEFPEVDRAAWVRLSDATSALHKGQAAVVDQLIERLANRVPGEAAPPD